MNIKSGNAVSSYYIHEIEILCDGSTNLHLAPADGTRPSLILRITSSENELIAEKIRLAKR